VIIQPEWTKYDGKIFRSAGDGKGERKSSAKGRDSALPEDCWLETDPQMTATDDLTTCATATDVWSLFFYVVCVCVCVFYVCSGMYFMFVQVCQVPVL
jgi:hypothetical protein